MIKLKITIAAFLLISIAGCAPSKMPGNTMGELSVVNITPVGRFYFSQGKLLLPSCWVQGFMLDESNVDGIIAIKK